MSWCRKTTPIILFTLFSACKQENNTPDGKKTFFDIRSFFTLEVSRLSKNNVPIIKKVSDNGNSQVRRMNIANWQNELSLFLSSDINKASWKNSYNIQKQNLSVVYTARDPDLHTRKIKIERSADGRVKQIEILNDTHNALYSSLEKLVYYPDSLYRIDKLQKVTILGSNHYIIEGKWQ